MAEGSRGDIALSLEWIRANGTNKDRLMRMDGSKEYLPNVLFTIKRNKGCSFSKWGTEAKWSRTDIESPSF